MDYTSIEFETKIKAACLEHKSMAAACASLQMHFNTFKRHATRLGVYTPNQSGKGMKKNNPSISINDIIVKGRHPQYQSNKLRIRLIREGIKAHQCEICRLTDWLEKPIPLELDHIDGDRTNHLLENLRLLCPNCHTFTPTFRGKNAVKH